MITYLFPGQGAQYKGMGKELFSEFPEIVTIADSILNYSIEELCLNDEFGQLDNTEYTQPALYVVNCLYYLRMIKETEKRPDYIIGNSLGEYNALYAAGCISFEEGLRLVQKRGKLMGRLNGGSMAAVLGLSSKKIKDILLKENISDSVQISNYNTKYQNVISGASNIIDNILPVLIKNGANRAVKLKVSGAFHSKYMKEAQDEFASELRKVKFKEAKCKVISNLYGIPYEKKYIYNTLLQQISNPVRLFESIKYAIECGTTEFIEVGPKKTMTKIVNTIKKELNEEVDYNKNHLGSNSFKEEYKVNYSYVVAGIQKGISSVAMIEELSENKILGFLGINGLSLDEALDLISSAKKKIPLDSIGVKVSNDLLNPDYGKTVMKHIIEEDIKKIEVSGYQKPDLALVKYRLRNIKIDEKGNVIIPHKMLVHITSVKAAQSFMRPIPENILKQLLDAEEITLKEAENARNIPMCDDICIDNNKGENRYGWLSTLKKISKENFNKFNLKKKVRIGIGGGIGSPQTVAMAFFAGADFIVTSSINQCTVEAGTSDYVKSLLQNAVETDFTFAPEAELFEFGEKKSVLKRGSLYHIRALKLYENYCRYESIKEIPQKEVEMITKKYFKVSFDEVYNNLKDKLSREIVKLAEEQPKYKMALIFKELLEQCFDDALKDKNENRVNYQIKSTSAIADLNNYLKDTYLMEWKNRKTADIGKKLMEDGEKYLIDNCRRYIHMMK